MMTCHELFGFMTADKAHEILNYAYASDKDVYRSILAAVAGARKVRPVFLEKKPRPERHKDMVHVLASPGMEASAGLLIRTWLLKTQSGLLQDFLDALGIAHKDGVVEQLPASILDDKLKGAIEILLERHPRENIVIYLNAFCAINDAQWENLEELLRTDSRLHLA